MGKKFLKIWYFLDFRSPDPDPYQEPDPEDPVRIRIKLIRIHITAFNNFNTYIFEAI